MVTDGEGIGLEVVALEDDGKQGTGDAESAQGAAGNSWLWFRPEEKSSKPSFGKVSERSAPLLNLLEAWHPLHT